jgi:hypothetical protein
VALEIKAARRSTQGTPDEIRQLIREMSVANPLWGAPRIHGELLKLGIDVGQTTVAKYMAKRRPLTGLGNLCSQRRRHRVDRHVRGGDDLVGLLYGLLILRQSRRELLWLGVTAHPSAEWLARQLTEACGWDEPPRYLIRDRDGAYGAAFIRRIRAMAIRDRPVSARSSWQTDMRRGRSARSDGNVLITSSSLASAIFATFSHRTKHTTTRSETHLSLQKDAPVPRDVCRTGRVRSSPILGGLHHQYVRV